MKHLIPKTMTAVPVLALALAVGGCGSSSDGDDMMAEPTPEEMCTAAGGEWANGECTTAQDLADARADMQRDAIESALMTAREMVNAVDNDSTDAQVSAADAAVAAARSAIAMAADVPMNEKDANTGTVNALATQLSGAKMARMDAMNEADRMAREAMAATAAKLYAGIYMPAADATGTAVGAVHAAYNDAGTPTGSTVDTFIVVTTGDGTAANPAYLSEDEDTMVADNHGWKGKMYADPAGDDEYVAYVYSNVETPEEGDKFGQIGVGTAADGYEYGLTADGETVTGFTFEAENVASPSFDHNAGTKEFELPANAVRVMIAGTYHGVSGTYNCAPTGGGVDCSAAVATGGFTLAGGTWTFKPTNPEARVMDTADVNYASYGWWLRKAANDGPFTASAFHDFKGTAVAVDIANLVAGTAKYVGGAAGKYALASSTGGTNDAGHFTAMATLNAKFGATNTISGEITDFVGPDGGDTWTVELQEAALANDGAITRTGADQVNNDTVWTIGDMDAAASGEWSGNLREEGDDGVPKAATGTFYSEFGTAGKMVGAFGANKE